MASSVNIKIQQGFRQIFLIVFVSSFVITSCKVSWVATYDYMVAQQIDVVAKKIDKFYLTLLETTQNENEQRVYSKYAEAYIDIEVELSNLLQKNNRRDKNQESIEINKRILNKWLEYKEIHKTENQLSNADIEANKMNFENMMNTFRIAEELKTRIK
jgi:hypothetical protein